MKRDEEREDHKRGNLKERGRGRGSSRKRERERDREKDEGKLQGER